MARWYIIHAYSGFENKVKEAILSEAERTGLEALVEAVEVPSETVTEVKRGKKVQSERKTMPGYVLAKLAMTHITKLAAVAAGAHLAAGQVLTIRIAMAVPAVLLFLTLHPTLLQITVQFTELHNDNYMVL